MSKALYRKYRSKSLAEIVGQTHVTEILARSLEQGRIAHAYLLTGPRGVGKTSIARILAHEINKLPYDEETPHLDIIEIDAASNNGVEDVRDLREKVQIAPVSAAKKIYIIDEVHMLSKAAFNALLKTLEEPPEHAVFILATTDTDKLPATIISRTQQFNFRAITPKDAANHLRFIADKENIKIDDAALNLIALRGDGSLRDSTSLLDQLRTASDRTTGITSELVEQILGLAPADLVRKLLEAYEAKDLSVLVALIDSSEQDGVQATALTSQLIQAVREQLAEKPQLISLLDSLLEVARSTRPSVKLLTILAAHAAPRSKSAALIATTNEVSVPLAELEKQATKDVPVAPIVHPVIKKEIVMKRSNEGKPAVKNMPVSLETRPTIDFDWSKLIDYTREHYVAVYSVLSKCSYEINEETLVLYTGNKFYKKKLDDSKHRINLQKSLDEIGADNLLIETRDTPPPPKDSQAAAVAAIMGGGEEVSVA